MCQIMLDESEHIALLLTGKRAVESRDLDAMRALAKAFEKRSLAMYHEVGGPVGAPIRAQGCGPNENRKMRTVAMRMRLIWTTEVVR